MARIVLRAILASLLCVALIAALSSTDRAVAVVTEIIVGRRQYVLRSALSAVDQSL